MRHFALQPLLCSMIAPRYAPEPLSQQYSRLVEIVPRFPQGTSAPGCGRAALASLMWNGVDTTSRATIPGWEHSRHATMSCDLVLQLGFSFCQNGLILLWIADVLAYWRYRAGRAQHQQGTLHRPYTYTHTKIYTQLYLYLVNTRLSLPGVGHDCERLSLEARLIWEESLRSNAGT